MEKNLHITNNLNNQNNCNTQNTNDLNIENKEKNFENINKVEKKINENKKTNNISDMLENELKSVRKNQDKMFFNFETNCKVK